MNDTEVAKGYKIAVVLLLLLSWHVWHANTDRAVVCALLI